MLYVYITLLYTNICVKKQNKMLTVFKLFIVGSFYHNSKIKVTNLEVIIFTSINWCMDLKTLNDFTI